MTKYKDMEQALDVLKTLNHPVRLSILCNLIEKQEMSAGSIVEQEKELASQSQVSQYLRWLRDRDYVAVRKQGQFSYYSISSPEIRELIEKMHELFCAESESCA
ncbi:MAG: metalloregulator ArsR/SmtB family transcription factor [Emcibacter sp.]|jgi:DNA-binding transcriptional ArsR family regulator|nr:metalloregulator ArsR/SmtB family transcription factor [Emcibacter sp.]